MDNTRAPFLLYRVLAYVTGVLLILLAFVAMPAKYLIGADARFSLVDAPAGMEAWFGVDTPLVLPIAMPHGWIYMAYVLVVLWLALGRRWGAGKTLGVIVAGTIPFAGLVVEHRLAKKEEEARRSEAAAAAP